MLTLITLLKSIAKSKYLNKFFLKFVALVLAFALTLTCTFNVHDFPCQTTLATSAKVFGQILPVGDVNFIHRFP